VTETHCPEEGKLTCRLCNTPINLFRDLFADENGKIMHETCYVRRLISSRNYPPDTHHMGQTLARDIIDPLTTVGAACECCQKCSTCGTSMEHRASMFFFEGQTWDVLLAFCPKCNPVSQVPYRAHCLNVPLVN
jgi:hypothetical protein